MSSKIVKNNSKLTLNATMILVEQSAFKVLLLEAFDELTENRLRGTWLTITMTLFGASVAGIIEWFIEDVAAASSLSNFAWLCPKTMLYGCGLILSAISLLVYWATMPFACKRSKAKFIEKYVNHSSIDIINQGYQVTASTLRNPTPKSATLKTTEVTVENTETA